MAGDEEFEQRRNVRWENDFGPDTAMWKRYLMAAVCMALVLGFLAVAIFLLGDAASGEPIDYRSAAAFTGGFILLVVIALRGERWAIRIRRFFEGRPQASEKE